MATNMYRVGDCVYFETSSTLPYQIRRIEELNKTASGNVEAKVMCFYRRRDLPSPLIQLADKHQLAQSEDSPVATKLKKMWLKTPVGEEQAAQAVLDPATASMEEEQDTSVTGTTTNNSTSNNNSSSTNNNGNSNSSTDSPQTQQRYQMKHRELFLSRHVEILPATHIRGKCSVTLLNETESLLSYLNKDDTFFYCLVFDPTQKTLLADKGEIRVGSRYQTEMTNLIKEGEEDPRKSEELETLVWTPEHGLTDRQIDQFLVVSRSVGTFARALDCSSSVKQPSLHMSAAAASRDITLFHAMDTLHRHTYCLEAALSSLVPPSGPVLCRDEMEEWSASEANLFEEALDKYGKDFNDIRTDFLPWKTLKNIVEYYYMWKTTDRYVQQKRVKAVEAESKLKQVYIPNYNKPNPAIITNSKSSTIMNGSTNGSAANLTSSGEICVSCQTTSSQQWYAWGPSQLQSRLCSSCWQYWKKYGGFKYQSSGVSENEPEALSLTSGANNTNSAVPGVRARGRSIDGEEQAPAGTQAAFSHRPHRCSILNCGKEFKLKAQLARHYAAAHGAGGVRAGSPRPVMKTRAAFYLRTSPLTRLARRLSRALRRPRRIARAPFNPVNIHQVKHDCSVGMAGLSPSELAALAAGRGGRVRGSVSRVAERLAGPSPQYGTAAQLAWLRLTPKDRLPQPHKVAFPKPPKAPDGSLMYERIPNKGEVEGIRPTSGTSPTPNNLKRRYDELNGMDRGAGPGAGDSGASAGAGGGASGTGGGGTGGTDGGRSSSHAPPPAKRPNKHPQPMQRPSAEQYAAMCARAQATGQPLPKHIFAHVNGKPGLGGGGRGGRRHVISWMDAPDDLYFRATDRAKVRRRVLSLVELRRAARKPWRNLSTGAKGGGSEAPSGAGTGAPSGGGNGTPSGGGTITATPTPMQVVILD